MNSESFVFYESVYKQGEILNKKLGPEVALQFYNAVIMFGLYGVVPEEDDTVWLYGFEQTITSISSAKSRRQAAIENGKKGGRKPTVDKEKILKLKEAGFKNKEIADQVGCSVSTVEKTKSDTGKTGKTLTNLNVNVNVNDNENENVLRLSAGGLHPATVPSPGFSQEEEGYVPFVIDF